MQERAEPASYQHHGAGWALEVTTAGVEWRQLVQRLYVAGIGLRCMILVHILVHEVLPIDTRSTQLGSCPSAETPGQLACGG